MVKKVTVGNPFVYLASIEALKKDTRERLSILLAVMDDMS